MLVPEGVSIILVLCSHHQRPTVFLCWSLHNAEVKTAGFVPLDCWFWWGSLVLPNLEDYQSIRLEFHIFLISWCEGFILPLKVEGRCLYPWNFFLEFLLFSSDSLSLKFCSIIFSSYFRTCVFRRVIFLLFVPVRFYKHCSIPCFLKYLIQNSKSIFKFFQFTRLIIFHIYSAVHVINKPYTKDLTQTLQNDQIY